MLEINGLTVIVNHKEIIKDLSFVLNSNDKVAIIGEEGNGKSTLIKVITSNCDYANFTGTINTKGNKIGYLKQFIDDKDLNKKVFDYLFSSMEDYYNKINSLYRYLKELNFSEDVLEKEKILYLSGGEKVKLQLLNLLLEEPDILILDEPSNDLDIDTVKWLESFISNCDKPILYVSHDEMLLSRTANAILHLELVQKKKIPKWTYKNIGYDEYVNERVNYINHTTMVAKKEKSNFDKKQEKLNKIMNKVEHQQNTISRSDPHGAKMLKRKMKSIKAQEKRMNEKELTNIPDYEESIYFSFEESNIPNKKKVIELIDYKISIDHKVLARNINLNIMGSEHIVIIGRNGCGKTTLLNSIYNLIKNRIDIKVGYMPQNYDDILSDYNSAIDFLCKDADKEYISKARSYLGNMNFTSDEMTASINDLSGGSKAKLIMIKLVLDRCNVLILDEPTRNVSPLSNPIIRETLRNFKGTIISVSHDRKYINFVCSKIYELDELGLHYISSI